MDLTQTREIFAPPEGTLITPQDFADITADIDSVSGELIRAIGGPNFLPNVNPLTIVPGSGMAVTAGGNAQGLIAQGRFLDVCAATSLAIAPAGTSDRVDLIAVQATRVPGPTTVNRTVVPDSAPGNQVAIKLTLANGTASFTFNPPFTAPPVVALGAEGTDANSDLSIAVSATSLTITNTADPSDTRTIDAFISGSAIGAAGSEQAINLLENRPQYEVITGTSTMPPNAPAGYEALATVYVHANESSIAQGDISFIFEQLASPILDAAFRHLSAATITTSGNSAIGGSATVAGTLNAGGSTIGPLGVFSEGNVTSANGVFAAPAGVDELQFGPNNQVTATLDQNGNFLADGSVTATGNVISKNGVFSAPGGVDELQFAPNNTVTATLDASGNFKANGSLGSTGNVVAGNGVFSAPPGVDDLQFAPNNAVKAVLDQNGNFTIDGSISVPGNAVIGDSASVGGNLEVTGSVSAGSYNGPLVNSINELTGNVGITNADASVSVTENGDTIEISANGVGKSLFNAAQPNSTNYTLELPGGALPPGTWILYAFFQATGTGSLQGSGANWNAKVSGTSQSGYILQLTGTAQGGQTPSITLTTSGVPANGQVLTFEATRVA